MKIKWKNKNQLLIKNQRPEPNKTLKKVDLTNTKAKNTEYLAHKLLDPKVVALSNGKEKKKK
jgi:hypothetical protein